MTRIVSMFITLLAITLIMAACGSDEKAPTIDPANAAAIRGEALFRTYCATCHVAIGERVVVGPPLTNIATTAAERFPDMTVEEYLRESIITPDAYIVPGFKEGSMQQNFATQLTSQELDDVIAYLLTLE